SRRPSPPCARGSPRRPPRERRGRRRRPRPRPRSSRAPGRTRRRRRWRSGRPSAYRTQRVKTIPDPAATSGPERRRLDAADQAQLARDGYVARTGVFSPNELDAIGADCEALVNELVRDRHGHRLEAGSYVFEPDLLRHVIIKWEGDSDVVHGIEP